MCICEGEKRKIRRKREGWREGGDGCVQPLLFLETTVVYKGNRGEQRVCVCVHVRDLGVPNTEERKRERKEEQEKRQARCGGVALFLSLSQTLW